MGLFDEINRTISNGEDCIPLLERKIEEDAELLKKSFCFEGKQQTVLNALIALHSEEHNLLGVIQWCISQPNIAINLNQPVHFALTLKKLDIVHLILKVFDPQLMSESRQKLDLDARDAKGKTLIYQIIHSSNKRALALAIRQGINIHQPSDCSLHNDEPIELQPLQQSVVYNHGDAVEQLLNAGAQVDNPYDDLNENSLLLAARIGAVKALEKILLFLWQRPIEKREELLAQTTSQGYRAIDFLCIRLLEKKEPEMALRGIAMLLCQGSETPNDLILRNLLKGHRDALFQQVKEYTKDCVEWRITFVRRCHDKRDPLHEIMYAKDTWGQSVKQFFGRVDTLAFELEALVPIESSGVFAKETPESFNDDEVLYAEFVKRYSASVSASMVLFNLCSEMRHLIAKGGVTCWKDVRAYADEHPNSRTDKIVKQMTRSLTNPFEEESDAEQSKALSLDV